MKFSGVSSKTVVTKVLHVNCPQCNQIANLKLSLHSKYLQIVLVPTLPAGTDAEVVCGTCHKTTKAENFSNEINAEYQLEKKKIKTPLYYWSGSLILASLLALSFAIEALGFKDIDKREQMLEAVFDKFENSPAAEHSIAQNLKAAFESKAAGTIDVSSFKYFAKDSADRVLLFIKSPDYSQYKDDKKALFNSVLKDFIGENLKGKKVYLGIFGMLDIKEAKTPEGDAVGIFQSELMLCNYFGSKPIIINNK